ncbi:hypothetical protein P9578_15285 [Brevibacillus choshinensis]|uniref:hypothetical protein n=1 Tax=Brevibacillus choshinensis TaxID=54911 RepID=UPI002E1D30D7|nr:hypothetical protein [Brevibacillus choshinensis]
MKRAVLFGASGLVGNALLHLLLAEVVYTDIIAFGRSALAFDHLRLHSRTIDFRHLEECQEYRRGEAFGARISPLLTHLMIGPFRVFRPVQAKDVAAAMIHVSRQEIDGNHIYPSDEISRLAHLRK